MHFRTVPRELLEAALFTLSKQSFEGVDRIIVYDNNSEHSEDTITACVNQHLSRLPVPVVKVFDQHGDSTKTQSYSVNRVVERCTEWVFFTRSDFLLDYDCLKKYRETRDEKGDYGFITSYCLQMGFDERMSNEPDVAPYSYESAPWRQDPAGPRSLIGNVPAYQFHTTDLDAGVWLAHKTRIDHIEGLNERMSSWGFQQQEFQRRWRERGWPIHNIPEYLFMHQHHWADRNFTKANDEIARYGRR